MTMQRFETPGAVTVLVRNDAGEVELATRDGATTDVDVSALGDDADDLVERTRVDEERSGDGHRVVVEVPHTNRSAAGGRERSGVRVVVGCPIGSRLEVKTASASVEAEGRFGPVDIQSASGEVRIESVAGDLKVGTASGDVSVETVEGNARIETASGDVHCGTLDGGGIVNTASGDIEVESAAAPLDLRTASGDVRAFDVLAGCQIRSASGDQRVERIVSGRAKLDTVSGDLVIGIARGTAVVVDAQTVTGDLSSEIDLDAAGDTPGAGVPDGPTLDLRVRTVSGDVRVERAPAPA